MDECKHGLEPAWCSLCLGHEKLGKVERTMPDLGSEFEPRIRNAAVEPASDPMERAAIMAASGVLCPKCMTMTTGRGCACSRQQLYAGDMADAAEWCSSDQAKAGFTLKQLSGLVLSSQRRGGRYASLTAEEAADERAGLLKEFDVEPRWFAARRHEQDHLPI